MADTPKTRFELSVELTKALAWPILILIILAVFWTPLHDLVTLAPTLLGHSESITIAGVSIKLGQRLSSQASPEVKKELAAMSPHSIDVLLSHTSSAYWSSDPSYAKSEHAQLAQAGLVKELSSDDLRRSYPDKNYTYGIQLTEQGQEVRKFLIALISEFASQLQESQPATKQTL
ncbi:MAG TPA: hypothetical protein VKZ53_26730 [Candidatus Angelobacter sp.]|nr:hypothetical protein [Candidatus Angelobacter sp.]